MPSVLLNIALMALKRLSLNAQVGIQKIVSGLYVDAKIAHFIYLRQMQTSGGCYISTCNIASGSYIFKQQDFSALINLITIYLTVLVQFHI
jgi:hypothetical protein